MSLTIWSLTGQIEHWVRIGKSIEENPEYQFG
jgi:hypothetical protein